ncbi:MAG: hypothetical protein SX243_10420 [Acidobacteriota bacterium]|nr:hypothetical protein [Acidobacteriota bacterium]
MKTVRNTTRRPLTVNLPRGKKLHLNPLQEGQIATNAADHPPIVALVKAGDLEIFDTQEPWATGHGDDQKVHGSTHGKHADKKTGGRGDR